ncbi:MAG: spoVD [Phycisphaerales bacterium]|nr:spoVD [Phycisphaerales bacterium]
MFERRLKFFLGFLALFALVLVLRAGQVQVAEHDTWTKAAAETMKRSQLVETVRGSILDRMGKPVAVDKPCVDACVDYRAITDPPDAKWVAERAAKRLRARVGDDYLKTPKAERVKRIAVEAEAVRADVARMWDDLAQMSGRPAGEVADARRAIVSKVEMRQRLVRQGNYRRAMQEKQDRQETEAFWRRWLVEGLAGEKGDLDSYAVTVAEQTEAHVILRAVPDDVQTYLGKYADRFPGVELRASTHRTYPYGAAGCHLMGRVSKVTREDLLSEDNPKDEARQYLPNDQVGRGGVEQLLEPALRGAKGKVVRVPGQDAELSRTDPVAGQDVRLTIDIELQARLEAAFTAVELVDPRGEVTDTAMFHGAAVAIDVATGDVLAMASYPTFDLNTFDELYAQLHADEVNAPLMNRATQAQLQPGSTMKTVVGLGGVTQGVVRADEGIECTGYLVIDGKRRSVGRCWVASQLFNGARLPNPAHHPIPVPHPTGNLTFGDALERSCNVYFETVADRLGLEGLSVWGERFGLGRPTGVGIAEARGRLPRAYKGDGPAADRRFKTWFAGIGQDPVAATPIQMANVAATIARGGVWMRPRLVSAADAARAGVKLPALRPAPQADGPDGKPLAAPDWPDAYDLGLDPAAVAAAKDGMQRVVYGSAGTGKQVAQHAPALAGLRVAGKTGSAQASKFSIKIMDPATGKQARDEKNHLRYEVLEPSTPDHPNERAPWYRGFGDKGRELAHGWYIGFAPADHPRVAFATMTEYGGSGGRAAGGVARQLLTACVELGYFKPDGPGGSAAGASAAVPVGPQMGELLRDAGGQ